MQFCWQAMHLVELFVVMFWLYTLSTSASLPRQGKAVNFGRSPVLRTQRILGQQSGV